MASATDAGGRIISTRVSWTSSVDGALGSGLSFTRVLSRGTHRITARVTDSRGRTRSTEITITVE
jgi:hypothetical protein